MRIVHLQKAAGKGGAEKHLTLLLPALVQAGMEVWYLITETREAAPLNDPIIREMEAGGVQCRRIRMRSDLDPVGLLSLFRAIRKTRPDILHTHLIQGDLYGAIYTFFYKKIYLLSSRHGYDESFQAKYGLNPEFLTREPNLYYRISRFTARRADRIICISEGLTRLVRALPGVEAARVRTIPYGYGAEHHPEPLPVPEYLLYVGRLIPFKHPDLLIESYVHYRLGGGLLDLKIAGSGPSETVMREKLSQAGLSETVQFLGRIPQPEQLLPGAACLVVSSLSEGFGLVSLEAMNAGIPILAFDVPALNEVVVHQQTGILCRPGDVQDMANGMHLFAENESLRLEYGQAGRKRLLAEYSVRKMVNQLLEIYRERSGK